MFMVQEDAEVSSYCIPAGFLFFFQFPLQMLFKLDAESRQGLTVFYLFADSQRFLQRDNIVLELSFM